MRRTIATATLALLFAGISFAHSWEVVTERVERSLVRITFECMLAPGQYHTCSGFPISEHTVLTAYHCITETVSDDKIEIKGFQVDGLPSFVLQSWPEDDLVVVNYLGFKPWLEYRRKPVRKGLPVASLGFGQGLPTSTLMEGSIAAPEADYSESQEGKWLMLGFPIIKGMSGGPIFDEEGRVVGVNQQSDGMNGYSKPLPTILKRAKKYWR